MTDVVIATTNRGKFGEIRRLISAQFDNIHSLLDFDETVIVDEDSPHYAENAMKKARKVGNHFGMPALADDSGLEVAALGGRPGIHSSRYGTNDEERIQRLLGELEGVPWEERKATFKAYVALYLPQKDRCYLFYGELKGYIGFEEHGSGGFGYDPVFYSPELGRYLAELSTEEKNALSHRGRAIAALKRFIGNK
ncbi:MAG: RdgB/HAM1 family non-canonical purine NTP pyrophosphatase [Syntrophorhabdus sp.]|jgi:XTP/dITP diphosphohydrolase|nr:RdgB/HAM1 family non-canonical purine NTP pyrophosphatase [Syntrophorhabdus sp.]